MAESAALVHRQRGAAGSMGADGTLTYIVDCGHASLGVVTLFSIAVDGCRDGAGLVISKRAPTPTVPATGLCVDVVPAEYHHHPPNGVNVPSITSEAADGR